MLTYNDVQALCDLTEEEVEAIAEHEHIPEICAAELGYYLTQTEEGVPVVHRIILDDIEAARAVGDTDKETRLRAVLKHFIRTHPEAASRGGGFTKKTA